MASSNEIIRQTNQKRLAALLEDYEAANQQLAYLPSNVDQIRLKRQIKNIEAEIREVEEKLSRLSGDSSTNQQDNLLPVPLTNLPSKESFYRVLIDEYHGRPLFKGRLQRELKGKGFEVITMNEPYSRSELFVSDIFAIWFPRYFEGKEAHFSNVEVALIKEYLEQGGNALLVGLGWAWTRHGRQSIDTYPLNHIADDYGIFFNDAVISHMSGVSHDEQAISFHQPFMGHHSITQNVSQISSPKSAPGSLVVSSSATPLIWGSDQLRDSDGARNPIILAAASAGQGKLVCLQHAGYIDSLHDDNFILLVNIFNWLVDKAEGGNR